MGIAIDLLEMILGYLAMALAENRFVKVLLNPDVLVAFRVKEDLFFPLGIFETDLIEPAAVFQRERLDRALGFLVRQTVWRHLLGVVNAASNQRLVGVTLEEIDDHFLADTGDKHGA